MELAEALKRRHMSRKFTDRPVEKEKLDQLLYAAGRAPQGGNMPVREYVVVTDPRYMKLCYSVSRRRHRGRSSAWCA